jgi:hypothetical protein
MNLLADIFTVTVHYCRDITDTGGVHEDIDGAKPIPAFLDDASDVVRLCVIEGDNEGCIGEGICQILYCYLATGREDRPMALPENILG